ncbi:hypothetical protein A2U01_0088070, partial [Trifolium medium]|nr:hypothetical protein [Trifolium medium]
FGFSLLVRAMAVELVGGALLYAFLQVTFEKLASADIG